jgi:hypothetical protein
MLGTHVTFFRSTPTIQLVRNLCHKIGIRILYNYLPDFEKIRAGDCEIPLMVPPDKIKFGLPSYLSGQVGPISSISQPPTQIFSNSGK